MTYQVPPETACFVDREEEQARAFRAVAEWGGRSRPLVLALSGLGGTGKTELAFRIARRQRDRYPDGVLYVDLDDLRRDGAVEVSDVLGELLRSLGVGAEWLGHSFQARCKQYWAQTDRKRLVVIVDNARYGAEVTPLLPASGESLAIVTSHGPLYELESGAVVELALDPLDDGHAMELLRRVADDPRLLREAEAAVGLVRLCSGLPAALHVAGRWMRRHRRRPLARLLDDLTAELHEKGLPVVERVWDAAYRGLGARAASLYRLLAGAPGPAFTAESAAALAGCGPEAAVEALEELENAGLLDGRGERFRLPELLRAHAARCAVREGGERETAEGQHRIVRWYLRQAQRADALAAGARLTLADPEPPVEGAPDVRFEPPDQAGPVRAAASTGQASTGQASTGQASTGQASTSPAGRALAWLEAERHALHACVRIAYARGLDRQAWALCEPLWTHFLDHPHGTGTVEAFRTGVAAAQRAGDVPALVRMRCQLARPLWEREDFAGAEQQMQQALGAAQTLGDSDRDRKLAASAVEFRGMLRSARGDWAAAAADFRTARETHRAIGNDYGVMLQTYRWGQAMAELGDLERAVTLLEQAHAMAGELGRHRMTARTGFALGGVLRGLGRADRARALYETALAGARDRGAEGDEARVLDALAALAEETGRTEEARDHRAAAAAIRERNGMAP
ncbi:tetratricopeptide repeat protein [Streptomyces sp. NPDC006134]|uniref:tetratricopeptide repeat protein n=1 Tax=Streptomyces sp. NPDC006134 TaxID=3154467 RepID=UPI0033F46449